MFMYSFFIVCEKQRESWKNENWISFYFPNKKKKPPTISPHYSRSQHCRVCVRFSQPAKSGAINEKYYFNFDGFESYICVIPIFPRRGSKTTSIFFKMQPDENCNTCVQGGWMGRVEKNDHHRVGIKQHWEGEAGKRDSDEGTKKKTIREPVSSILDFSQSSFLRSCLCFFLFLE